MDQKVKIAAAAPIQVGGSLFTGEQLALIGSIAGQDVLIEMTPFKQLYIEVAADRKAEIEERLRNAGLEIYPQGAITKNVYACNFCKGAKEAGLETARRLNKAIAGIETPTPLKVGYAGCALGTSEPLLKDIGIIKMKDRFNIYLGGEPKGIKAGLGELLISDIDEEQMIPFVLAIIKFYIANAKGKESFSKFVKRLGIEKLQSIITKI